jgi:hypothetical protein
LQPATVTVATGASTSFAATWNGSPPAISMDSSTCRWRDNFESRKIHRLLHARAVHGHRNVELRSNKHDLSTPAIVFCSPRSCSTKESVAIVHCHSPRMGSPCSNSARKLRVLNGANKHDVS